MQRPPRGARFPLPLASLKGALGAPAAPAAAARPVLRPQRHLEQAVADAARLVPPSGLGMDSSAVRSSMVAQLRASGIGDEAVLAAFARVERHAFVDTALVNQAYEDTSLPIGLGQTISKPSVVARMLCLLRGGAACTARGNLGHVLEIGTGCGYQAALLAVVAERVVSMERLGALAQRAGARLQALGLRNVRVLHGDGRAGHAALAPYHGIVSAAGGDEIPRAWLEQLAPGGRLVTPWFDPERGTQVLAVIDRGPAGYSRQLHDAVHFVPLKSGAE